MNKQIQQALYQFKVDRKYWDKDNLTGPDNDFLRGKPALYLQKAIEIAKILNLKTVVEIGSTRLATAQKCLDFWNAPHEFTSPPCCNDGHGGIFWTRAGFDVHTVDIDSNHIKQLHWSFENVREPMPSNLHIHIPKDGVEFLTEFSGVIDVLFLDGWDVGSHQYKEKHLEAFKAAQNKLADIHLILIDDTDYRISEGGKDAHLSPFLIELGYTMLFNGRQTLFINKS